MKVALRRIGTAAFDAVLGPSFGGFAYFAANAFSIR